MADTVTTNIQQNGFRNAVTVFTNLSDGTGEAGVLKVDATSTGPYGVSKMGQTFYPGIHLKIWKINYSIKDMGVRLLWDATADEDAVILAAGTDELDFSSIGGLIVPPALAGATGSIRFTTIGAMANASYTVALFMKKNVPSS